jgi:type IV pilus assembly protein PilC
MRFEYRGKNRSSETVTGSIDADSANHASDILLERDLVITSLKEISEGFDFMRWVNGFFNRVSKKDLSIVLRQLAILISAAVPLVQALRILSQQPGKQVFRDALADIVNEVEGGSKLSSALSRYPNIFSEYFISMIRSGETSGRLDDVLNYLADQQEKDYELQSKISGALMYPTFVILIMLIAGAVMMFFVLPKMLAMFTALGPNIELPITTQFLIGFSNFSQNYWWVLLLGFFTLITLFAWYAGTPVGKRMIDYAKLRIPVFGNLFQSIYLVRFTRSFSTILVGGVTIPMGLRIVKDVIGNTIYEDLITATIKEVEDGNPISSVFSKSKEVPAIVSQMISVGEQTGRLDDVLNKVTEFYVREINTITENALSLIEPLIMVMLGLAVGVMVSGILLPMYQLTSNF